MNQALLTTISVKTEKFNQCRTLSINIQTNVRIDFSKQYFIGTKPVKLDVPVAAFAYLYLGEAFRWNYAVSFLFLIGAVYFAFR